MEDIERVKDRLGNIRSVEPIITSLRTISAGGWRLALRRQRAAGEYVEHLSQVLASLLPRIPASAYDAALVTSSPPVPRRAMVLVIASERGLCGAFNDMVLTGAERLIAQQQLQSQEVLITTLGAKAQAFMRSRGHELFLTYHLPVTSVVSFESVREIGQTLIDSLYSNAIDALYVVYSPYRAATILEPVSRRWLPLDRSILPTRVDSWIEPIVETDSGSLFQRLIEEWIHVRLYQLIMESAASEHAARFRAMDTATSNLQRVIEELTLAYHTARQHAITMEILDLAAGSGILRGPSGTRGR